MVINSPMQLVGTNADIYGGSSIWGTNADADVIRFTEKAAGSAIEGLAIRVSGTQKSGHAGISVDFPNSLNGSGMTPLRIENAAVSNTYDGIWIHAANNVVMSNLLLVGFEHDGIRAQHTVGLYLNNTMVAAASNADIEIENSAGIQFNSDQTYNGGTGILISNSSQIFFQGVIADTMTSDAYSISNSRDLSFVGSWAAGSMSGHGVSLSNVNNFAWSGGFIRSNKRSGVLIGSDCQSISLDNASLSANGFKNTTGSDTYGIYVSQPVKNLRVQGSRFGDIGEDSGNKSQTYALYFSRAASASAELAVIQGNQDQNDTFTNSRQNPWVLAGNKGQLSWVSGNEIPTGTCANGSLYSALISGGVLYFCANSQWRAVTLQTRARELPKKSR
jgi:hypothetical protein